jgi:hypothetical protein
LTFRIPSGLAPRKGPAAKYSAAPGIAQGGVNKPDAGACADKTYDAPRNMVCSELCPTETMLTGTPSLPST